jgi:hypothetical protein
MQRLSCSSKIVISSSPLTGESVEVFVNDIYLKQWYVKYADQLQRELALSRLSTGYKQYLSPSEQFSVQSDILLDLNLLSLTYNANVSNQDDSYARTVAMDTWENDFCRLRVTTNISLFNDAFNSECLQSLVVIIEAGNTERKEVTIPTVNLGMITLYLYTDTLFALCR